MIKISTFLLAILFIFVHFQRGIVAQTLVINEFMASNATSLSDESGSYPDWIELYNAGTTVMNLAGMYLSDDPATPLKHQFPYGNDSTEIQPGEYLILWADNDSEEGVLHVSFQLSAGGESIALYTSSGNMVDFVTFDEQVTDVSYGRFGDGSPDWIFYGNASPGTSNPLFYLSPSETEFVFTATGGYSTNLVVAANVNWTASSSLSWISLSDLSGTNDGVITITSLSANTTPTMREGIIELSSTETGNLSVVIKQLGNTIIPPIVINEVMASNANTIADEFGDFDDWFELYNKGNVPIDLGGYYLTDDLGDPLKHQIPIGQPALTTIQPNSYLLFWADDEPAQGVLHLPFKLSASGEDLGLYIDSYTPIDLISFPTMVSDQSYGRISDGINSWTYFDEPTPGSSNSTVSSELLTLVESWMVYPNPGQGLYYLQSSLYPIRIRVFNASGQILVNESISSRDQAIDLQSYPTGIYFLEIQSDKKRDTKKIIHHGR